MAQGLPRTIAAILVAVGVVHCSLIAPSDQELMGGNKGGSSSGGSGSSSGGGSSGGDAGDAGDSGDAGDASRSDAMDGSQGGDVACGELGDSCGPTSPCCSGMVCNTVAGICEPCVPNGGSCSGAGTMCCSGNCTGHSCR